jgi:hypothetical protein
MAGPRAVPHFLVVGSPRAGTTLVQRLACELTGVTVPPETHFFTVFFEQYLRHQTFPMSALEIREALDYYLSIPAVAGLPLDREMVVRSLEGHCSDAWTLFSAVVQQLGGAKDLVGEKTPDHLRWWRPLSRASPDLKFIAVVRDVRSVVASARDTPFGMDAPALIAASWSEDVRELDRARTALGEARILTLRYEDVVRDPDRARSRLSAFLGVVEAEVSSEEHGSMLFPDWERAWKERATGPIDPNRILAWRSRLDADDQRKIEAVVHLAFLGHPREDDRISTRRAVRALTMRDWLRLARFYRSRLCQRRRLRRLVIG